MMDHEIYLKLLELQEENKEIKEQLAFIYETLVEKNIVIVKKEETDAMLEAAK